MTPDLPLPAELLDDLRAVRRAFVERIEPVRPELYRYCRRLTGQVWDAEDLLQETLARAFARAAVSHQTIERMLPWLVRIATNIYIDSRRRPAPTPAELPERASSPDLDPLEVRAALGELATLLPPQERAALVLKDVFDFPLAEIAGLLGTSVGAVKAALHRGRDRLGVDGASTRRRPAPDRAVLDAMAEAFTAYDLDRLTGLLLDGAVSEVVGAVYEDGADVIRRGSLHHTLVIEDDRRYRAEVHELDGEPLLVLWARPTVPGADGESQEAVADILRVETAAGRVTRVRWYYFCTQTLLEVSARLGLPARPLG